MFRDRNVTRDTLKDHQPVVERRAGSDSVEWIDSSTPGIIEDVSFRGCQPCTPVREWASSIRLTDSAKRKSL